MQGERRFFRACFRWLATNYPEAASRNLIHISDYGRWDDLIYIVENTKLENEGFEIIKKQLTLDMQCKTPSLLGKWMPSENASASETKRVANKLRTFLGVSHKEYRKMLSGLRQKINVLERLMSANEWDKIEFDKIPSKAGLIYRNAFARRDIIAKKYEAFAKDESTTVNADTLYPYEIVERVLRHWGFTTQDSETLMLEKYWNNLPDYLNGKECKMMCVVDTSGSMTWGKNPRPIDVAISLGMYCAERVSGPFANHYISFSTSPQLIEIEGVNFADKVKRIYRTNLCSSTNIKATFDLVKNVALRPDTKKEDIPDTLVIISDMQIDSMSTWGEDTVLTEMEKIRAEWDAVGLKMPKLVYWNVEARNPVILDRGENVSFVSGCSPVIFEQVIKGITGKELMMDKLLSERYNVIS